MHSLGSKILSLALISLPVAVSAEKYIDLNLGLAPSKSMLGVSYAQDLNEVNVGIKSFAFGNSGEYALQPGVSYNRYLKPGGFYGTATYLPVTFSQEGVEAGSILAGIGKSFQFTSWGIHLDANLATPLTGEFAQAWGYWIGAGVSYRFKLD